MTTSQQTQDFTTLLALKKNLNHQTLTDLFKQDANRFNAFSLGTGALFLDYSKNMITHDVMHALFSLAKKRDLQTHIEALFSGETVNVSEQRPALHTALRQSSKTPLMVNGQNIIPDIAQTQHNMAHLVNAIHTGTYRGATGKPITDIVNIGIGGSDLGPAMVCKALSSYKLDTIRTHFIANVDGTGLHDLFKTIPPAQTLFLISSKSFSTQETLTNAQTAKTWLTDKLNHHPKLNQHFVAMTANPESALAFGVKDTHIFPLWDYIGGRFSLWSAIGLPIALAIGVDAFNALLAGAEDMDHHFRTADITQNMPVIMALLSIWYNNVYHAHTHAVLVYDDRLALFPAYLQQLAMESNGKSVDIHGQDVNIPTGEIIFGGVGTNGQHAYHQLLHQGTHVVPVDFIIAKQPHHPYPHHHDILLANCLAQSQALMTGNGGTRAPHIQQKNDLTPDMASKLAKHKTVLGNKPSNTLLMDKITPKALGALIALYEHKVFTQSIIWQINAFDQWGVELGKYLAAPILSALSQQAEVNTLDASTSGLIQKLRQTRGK